MTTNHKVWVPLNPTLSEADESPGWRSSCLIDKTVRPQQKYYSPSFQDVLKWYRTSARTEPSTAVSVWINGVTSDSWPTEESCGPWGQRSVCDLNNCTNINALRSAEEIGPYVIMGHRCVVARFNIMLLKDYLIFEIFMNVIATQCRLRVYF